MENFTKDKVLVTGAAGYVGSHCVKALLEAGYKVRGTVRNPDDSKKVGFLKEMVKEKAQNLELVKADLLDKECWDQTTQGCKYVLHVASPFHIKKVKDELMIRPAVEGTLNVLESCLKNGIKKVIITSSIAAIWYGNFDKVVDEENWSIEKSCGGYEKSKLFAERAAWDFWRKNHGKIEIATINPGFILGPVLQFGGGASEQFMVDMLMRKMPGIPRLSFGIVDVRDVAQAHLLALEHPESNGKRYIIVAESLWMSDMALKLKAEFEKYGYKVPTSLISKCLLRVASIFDSNAKAILPLYGKQMKVDNSKSKIELKIEYHDVSKGMIEMGYDLIKLGAIPDKINKKKQK